MADSKITQLTALTTVDGSDVLPVVDVSTSITKKVTKDDLFKAANMIGKAGTGTSSAAFSTPGLAQGEDADLALYSTFENTGDNFPRRTADIIAGFNGSSWGTEYLSFNVGTNGTGNDSRVVTYEKMRIDSSGNVGIGTSSPQSGLHIYGLGQSTANITDAGNQGAFLRVSDSTNNTGSGGGVIFGNSQSDDTGAVGFAAIKGYLIDGNDNTTGDLTFSTRSGTTATALTERMRIDASGNVGIGVTSPAVKLDVRGTTSSVANFYQLTAANNTDIYINNVGSANNFLISRRSNGESWLYNSGADPFVFLTNATERMRIDSSGNVGIGTSGPAGKAHVALSTSFSWGSNWTSGTAVFGGATDSSGALGISYNDTSGGAIGAIAPGVAWKNISIYANDFIINGALTERMRIDNSGVVRPGADNTQTLGSASYRWSVVYAGTGTINTSDEREKQQIANLDDAERRVAVAIKGLVKKYKYNDAVTLKGDDARIHVGVIAQEVVAAFAAEGLDATRYALLCHDTWEAEPEETDDEGNVIKLGIEAGERYGIRYDELLAFMIAAL